MGSVKGKFMHKALAVLLTVALALTLNPASAMAGTAIPIDSNGVPQESYGKSNTNENTGADAQADNDGINGTEPNDQPDNNGAIVGTELDRPGQNGNAANQVHTDVSVRISSKFELNITGDNPVVMAGPQDVSANKYYIEAQASKGVAITDGGKNYFEYKISRVKAGDTTPQDVVGTWTRCEIDGTTGVATIKYDLASDAPWADNDAYTYTITVRDYAGIERSATVAVSCGQLYAVQDINDSTTSNLGVSVNGMVLKNESYVNAARPSAPIMNTILSAADGMQVDAFDISVVADNTQYAPYLDLYSVTLPIPNNLTSEQLDGLEVFHVENDGTVSQVKAKYYDFNSNKTAVIITKDASYDFFPLIYAVAYPIPESNKVAVTSSVEGEGGTIDILGTNTYGAGTNVRYTFLPWSSNGTDPGYELESVKVSVNGGAEEDITPVAPANFIDYTVPASGPVNIVAKFKQVEQQSGNVRVTAKAIQGADGALGSVTVEPGGTAVDANTQMTLVPQSTTATVKFGAGEAGTAVLDKVTVKVGNGEAKEVSVLNNTLVLSSVSADTVVEATFKYGVPPHVPEVSLAFDPAKAQYDNGSANGYVTSTDSPVYGTKVAISVVAREGYKLSDIYYTYDGSNVRQPIRSEKDNNGAVSYYIDTLTGKATVHAVFAEDIIVPDTDEITVAITGAVVTRVNADGTAMTPPQTITSGKLSGISKTEGLTFTVKPAEGFEAPITVQVKEGQNVKDIPLTGGRYHLDAADLGAGKTLEITCKKTEVTPPTPTYEDFTIAASTSHDSAGCAITPASTHMTTDPNSADKVRSVEFTITAASDEYVLRQISFTCAGNNTMPAVQFPNSQITHTDGTLTYKYTLTESTISIYDVRSVYAVFDYVPKVEYTVNITVDGTDKNGNPLTGDAAGVVSPSTNFTVKSGEAAHLSFRPAVAFATEQYKVEVSINGGDFKEYPRKTCSITNITADQNVHVRFIYGKGNEYDGHTISASMSPADGSGGHVVLDPSNENATSLEVANLGNANIAFKPADGYHLAYVVLDKGKKDANGNSLERVLTPGESIELKKSGTDYVLHLAGVTSDRSVYAMFSKASTTNLVKYDLKATGEGSGIFDPSGSVSAEVGSANIPVKVMPSAGSVIQGITVGSNGTTETIPLVGDSRFVGTTDGGYLYLPTTSTSGGVVTVTFAKSPEQVMIHTAVEGEGGTVSPLGDKLVNLGSVQQISFTPNTQGDTKYDLDWARIFDANGNVVEDITAKVKGANYSYTINGVSGEMYIRAAFKKVEDGGTSDFDNTKVIDYAVQCTAGGSVSPSGAGKLNQGASSTITVNPNSDQRVANVFVSRSDGANIRDVKDSIQNGEFTLTWDMAKAVAGSESGSISVLVVFEKKPNLKVDVSITAGAGGSVSPSGSHQLDVNTDYTLNFTHEASKAPGTIEMIYRLPDGSLTTKSIPLDENVDSKTIFISENLVGVNVLFKDKPSSGATTDTRKVSAVATTDGGGNGGSISPTKEITVSPKGQAKFFLTPKTGFVAASATLSGSTDNLIEEGATEVSVPYSLLGAGSNTLNVVFKKIEASADDADVDVDVNMNVSVSIDVMGSIAVVGDGVKVSPKHISFKATEENAKKVIPIYIFPDKDYKLTKLEWAFRTDDDSHAVYKPLSYSTSAGEGVVNDLSSGRSFAPVSNVSATPNVGIDALADDETGSAIAGGNGYYVVYVRGLDSQYEIKGELVDRLTLPADEQEDDTIKGAGETANVLVQADKGGSVSPSGMLSFPVVESGTTNFPMYVEPTMDGYVPTGIKYTFADGTSNISSDVKVGWNDIAIKLGMTGISVIFEDVGEKNFVKVTSSLGSGSTGGKISPEGESFVKKGESQSFTFEHTNAKAYLKELWVSYGTGSATDLVATGEVDKFVLQFTTKKLNDTCTVSAVFGIGTEDNPVYDNVEYVDVSTKVYTVGSDGVERESTEGGKVSPEAKRMVSGLDSQSFTFHPNPGYILDSVQVANADGTYSLDKDQLASREYKLVGITSNTTVSVKFVPRFYEVSISADQGGTIVYPSGNSIQVQKGTPLVLTVQPDSKHEVGKIRVSGLVNYNGLKAASGSEASRQSQHSFTAFGDGSIHVPFTELGNTPGNPNDPTNPDNPSGPTNPDDPSNPNDPTDSNNPTDPNNPNGQGTPAIPNKVENFTYTASTSGHGSINPSGTHTVPAGAITFTLTPDEGYAPVSITYVDADGEKTTIKNTSTDYTMKLAEDCQIIANFGPKAYPGPNNPASRTLRTLTSLAQTGDLQMPAIMMLLAIACGSLGVAILMNGRSRRRTERAAHTE